MNTHLFPAPKLSIAHRGARGHAPENTLFAARLAHSQGAHMWELDVNRTKDGQLIIMHDDDFTRTTNVSKLPQFADRAPWHVCNFTLDEVRTLDAGSWYAESDPFGRIAAGEISPENLAIFTGQSGTGQAVTGQSGIGQSGIGQAVTGLQVPTLKEALLLTKELNWRVNVEIKDLAIAANGGLGHDTVTAAVLALIAELDMVDSVLLSSFQHQYLREAKALMPSLATAALVEDVAPADPVALCQALGVIAYHPGNDIIPDEHIMALCEAGITINVWTVNSMDEAQRLLHLGVTGIITDFPAACLAVL